MKIANDKVAVNRLGRLLRGNGCPKETQDREQNQGEGPGTRFHEPELTR
jgi:hypothetical protein